MIEIRTTDNEHIMMQKMTLLWIFHIGVSYQNLEGQHFGFMFGIGPIELSFTVRLWNNDAS